MINHSLTFPIIILCAVILFSLTALNIYLLAFRKKPKRIKEREYFNVELEKKLSIFKSASQAEEEARERIARNLHDEINLMLAVHKQVLEKHSFDIEAGEFIMSDYYEEIANIEKIREAVTACANNLVPAFLLKNGLCATMQDHIRRINQGGKITARCNILLNKNISEFFTKQDELNIYRICLELLNNLMKHADPKKLTLTMSVANTSLLIQIDHDGYKTTTEKMDLVVKETTGLGLKSMKSRTLIQNATVSYFDNDEGPAITCLIPSTLFLYN